MAYPFVQMPTLDEFVKLVQNKHRAKLKDVPQPIIGPRGKAPVRYLEIDRPNGRTKAVLPEIAGDERLAPDVLRSLCARLKISAKDFGLTLD